MNVIFARFSSSTLKAVSVSIFLLVWAWGWPGGNYRLDVSVDGKFITGIPFSVVSAQTTAPAPSSSPEKKSKGLRAPQKAGSSDGLLGRWKCSNSYGAASLEFQTGTGSSTKERR